MAYAVGDVINFSYTGAAQTVQLPAGRYKLQVWGAQGGSYDTYYGGKGGYSEGELSIPKTVEGATTPLFVYVGQQPATVSSSRKTVPGGFNGGGNGQTRYFSKTYTYGQGGGGATDIRIGTNSLYARVIVAGGGGGSASENAASTKYGGGASGGSPQASYVGGQTSAGPGGSFGQGGAATTDGTNYRYGSGGGGGGWYGGGACNTYSDSTNYRSYNGGGSGFVWTGSNAPNGYLLDSRYYLSAASTHAGNTTFPNTAGGTEEGHQGNGYAKIIVLEIYKFAPPSPEGLAQTTKTYSEIGLSWRPSSGASGYKVYKDGTLVSTQTGTTYVDHGLFPAEKHTYDVTAYNENGESKRASIEAETTFAYYIVRPSIQQASFSVNPADINQKTVLQVIVVDELSILNPEKYYSGELYSGEV